MDSNILQLGCGFFKHVRLHGSYDSIDDMIVTRGRHISTYHRSLEQTIKSGIKSQKIHKKTRVLSKLKRLPNRPVTPLKFVQQGTKDAHSNHPHRVSCCSRRQLPGCSGFAENSPPNYGFGAKRGHAHGTNEIWTEGAV